MLRTNGMSGAAVLAIWLVLACKPTDTGDTADTGDTDTGEVAAPATPDLSWPGANAEGLATSLRLAWQPARDGDAAALDVTYDVEVALGPVFDAPVFSATDLSGHSAPVALPAPGEYAWRVRARRGEVVSEWTTARTFRAWQDAAPRDVLYQLVVRHFGNTTGQNKTDGTLTENGVGKFSDLDARALDHIAGMGVTHVYLTGVLQQATSTDWSGYGQPPDDPDILKGRAGSFFAVRDYFDVSPDYADDPADRLDEFDALVARIHAAGMKVLIDLVPNHVARSYASDIRPALTLGADDDQDVFFARDNHFFYLAGGTPLTLPTAEAPWQLPGMDGAFALEDGTSGRHARVTGNEVVSHTPSVNDWYETVKLNYGYDFTNGTTHYDPIPATWAFVDEVLAYWQARGVDGFRCDFAHLVPQPAWTWLIDHARDRDPDVYFAAEAYANLDGLVEAGFDAVYDDDTYDRLKGIYNGTSTKGVLDSHLAFFPDTRRPHALRYLENHDERRIASPIVPDVEPDHSGFGSPAAGIHLAPIAYLSGPGPVMVYNGQTVGEQGAGVEGFGGEDGRTSIFDYWRVPALADWVSEGTFDGRRLSPDQRALHETYRRLLHLAQHPLVTEGAYYGLDFHNTGRSGYPGGAWTFARYLPDAERLLVVVANFELAPTPITVRIPDELSDWAALPAALRVVQLFDETGDVDGRPVATLTEHALRNDGFTVTVPNQASRVYLVAPD